MPGATDDLIAWLARAADLSAATDADLLARFAAGRDQAAFAALVRRHGPVVYGVCRRQTRHAADAEDAFQATFLILAGNAARIGRPELLGNYLYGVALRVARKARRAADRRRKREAVGASSTPTAVGPAPPASDIGPVLDEELARLADRHRSAILLCDLQGMPRAEAAGLLGIPEGTLSSRLNAGRKKLAARLTRRGLAPAAGAAATAGGTAEAVPPGLLRLTSEAAVNVGGVRVATNVVLLATEGGWAVGKAKVLAVVALVAGTGVVMGWAKDEGPPPASPVTKPPAAAAEVAKPENNPAARDHTLRMVKKFEVEGRIRPPIWSGDGRFVAAWADDAVSVYDTETATVVPSALPPGNYPFGFDPQSSVLVTQVGSSPRGPKINVEDDGYTLQFWAMTGGPAAKPTRTVRFNPESGPAELIGVLRGGRSLLGIAEGPSILKGTMNNPIHTSKLVAVDSVAMSVTDLAARPGCSVSEFAVLRDGRLAVWWNDIRGGAFIQTLEVKDVKTAQSLWQKELRITRSYRGGAARDLVASPDGRYLVAVAHLSPRQQEDRGKQKSDPSEVKYVVLDATSGETVPVRLEEPPDEYDLTVMSLSFDGRLLAGMVSSGAPPGKTELCVWELPSGKLLKRWEGTAEAAFSPTKPVLAIGEWYRLDPPLGRGPNRVSDLTQARYASVVGFWDVSGLGK